MPLTGAGRRCPDCGHVEGAADRPRPVLVDDAAFRPGAPATPPAPTPKHRPPAVLTAAVVLAVTAGVAVAAVRTARPEQAARPDRTSSPAASPAPAGLLDGATRTGAVLAAASRRGMHTLYVDEGVVTNVTEEILEPARNDRGEIDSVTSEGRDRVAVRDLDGVRILDFPFRDGGVVVLPEVQRLLGRNARGDGFWAFGLPESVTEITDYTVREYGFDGRQRRALRLPALPIQAAGDYAVGLTSSPHYGYVYDVYDLRTGQRVRTIVDTIALVAMSPTHIAYSTTCWSPPCTLRIEDLATGGSREVAPAYGGQVVWMPASGAFGPDGTLAAFEIRVDTAEVREAVLIRPDAAVAVPVPEATGTANTARSVWTADGEWLFWTVSGSTAAEGGAYRPESRESLKFTELPPGTRLLG